MPCVRCHVCKSTTTNFFVLNENLDKLLLLIGSYFDGKGIRIRDGVFVVCTEHLFTAARCLEEVLGEYPEPKYSAGIRIIEVLASQYANVEENGGLFESVKAFIDIFKNETKLMCLKLPKLLENLKISDIPEGTEDFQNIESSKSCPKPPIDISFKLPDTGIDKSNKVHRCIQCGAYDPYDTKIKMIERGCEKMSMAIFFSGFGSGLFEDSQAIALTKLKKIAVCRHHIEGQGYTLANFLKKLCDPHFVEDFREFFNKFDGRTKLMEIVKDIIFCINIAIPKDPESKLICEVCEGQKEVDFDQIIGGRCDSPCGSIEVRNAMNILNINHPDELETLEESRVTQALAQCVFIRKNDPNRSYTREELEDKYKRDRWTLILLFAKYYELKKRPSEVKVEPIDEEEPAKIQKAGSSETKKEILNIPKKPIKLEPMDCLEDIPLPTLPMAQGLQGAHEMVETDPSTSSAYYPTNGTTYKK